MNPEEQLARKLAELRAAYLAEAPRRLAELWTAFARVQNGELAGLDQLRGGLHRLAGSGGSYGLMGVSEQARAGELEAHELIVASRLPTANECASLRERIQNLADAFAAASTPE